MERWNQKWGYDSGETPSKVQLLFCFTSSSSSGELKGWGDEVVKELARDPHEARPTASDPHDIFSLAISKSSKSNFFHGGGGIQ
jgi:hypothetical protein